MKKLTVFIVGLLLIQFSVIAQSNALIERVTKKLNLVNDYLSKLHWERLKCILRSLIY